MKTVYVIPLIIVIFISFLIFQENKISSLEMNIVKANDSITQLNSDIDDYKYKIRRFKSRITRTNTRLEEIQGYIYYLIEDLKKLEHEIRDLDYSKSWSTRQRLKDVKEKVEYLEQISNE